MSDPRTPGAITLFRIAGIPIEFHFTFLFLAAIFGFSGVTQRGEALLDVLLISAIFGSVLLHELGHALTAKHLGVRILSITMYPVGGVARMASQPTPREELWITAAGPAVNLVIAAVILSALPSLQVEGGTRQLLQELARTNVWLLLFNLIPAFPMDGGRLLRAGLALWKNERDATKIATIVGRVIAVAMGLYAIYSGHYILLFIAFMVFSGAQREQMIGDARHATAGVPVSAAMLQDFQTVDHAATLRDAAGAMPQATHQQDLPVMHGEQVIGLLRRAALARALHADPEGYVAGVMDRQLPVVAPDLDLAASLPLLEQAGGTLLVSDGSRLLGLLSMENVRDYFSWRTKAR
jgi:Zn-dependent protease/CBS domain-containing protein